MVRKVEDDPLKQYRSQLSFKGNPLLKRSYVHREWTAKEVEEFKKCANDPIYFIDTYCKIVHVDHGLIPFKLWDFQKDFVNLMNDNRFVISKYPRQSGKSSTTVGYILWYVLFHENVNTAILSNKAKGAQITLGRLQIAYMYLPNFLKQGVVVWNKRSVEFENGSKVQADSTTAGSIRGDTVNLVLMDEFAHVPNNIADDFFNSTYPTISSGKTTKIIIVSTPRGMNKYYTIWMKAIKKENEYVYHEVRWDQVPGRDEEFKKSTIKNTSQQQWDQEFECVDGKTIVEVYDKKTKQTYEIQIGDLYDILI